MSPLPSSLAPSPPSILLNVVLACLPRNNNTAMRKGTHVSSVPLSWRRSGLLLQASGRCPTSSWTRLLGVENSFEDRFDPVTPSVSSGNTRLSAASCCRSYLLQCLSVGLVLIGVFICTSSFLSASFFLFPLRPQQANPVDCASKIRFSLLDVEETTSPRSAPEAHHPRWCSIMGEETYAAILIAAIGVLVA
ncbi:hypothetical protein HPB51_019055 [Rhipicephalus microplus]|uniref:Transmembrane protein n=1 Tax=Rhipicephalus microplus TaxID=6941 RepID=A0A9J6D6Q7_RHIMP|nr:hypothetical protein HPB51_019055 [Rhipicephalus microplus]